MKERKDLIIEISEGEFWNMFEIKEKFIDCGTFGHVAYGIRKDDQLEVAIKYLKQNEYLDTFRAEAKIMKKINHDNVLCCIGLYRNVTKNQYMLITPYCKKGSLKKNLKHISSLSEKVKINLCFQLAKGIQALHSQNIMHRDLKPGNILVSDKWVLKICDLGFGKKQNLGGQTEKIGTPIYRDPNVLTGNYTKKIDIYSIGLVMDEIFRGRCYFENVNHNLEHEKIIFSKCKQKIIGELNCCQKMKQIIMNCIEKDEVNRWNANRLVDEFEALWKKYEDSEREFEKKIEKFRQEVNSKVKNRRVERIISEIDVQQLSEKSLKGIYKSEIKMLKKCTSINDKQNLQFISRVIHLSRMQNQKYEKAKNFHTIYNFFLKRKEQFRNIILLRQIKSFSDNEKQVIIFYIFFCYTRFLMIHKNFLKKKSSPISSIEGFSFEDLSDKIIKVCLQLVEEELKLAKDSAIKYGRQVSEGKELPHMIACMVLEVTQKKCSSIKELKIGAIVEGYEDLLRKKEVREGEKERINILMGLKQLFL